MRVGLVLLMLALAGCTGAEPAQETPADRIQPEGGGPGEVDVDPTPAETRPEKEKPKAAAVGEPEGPTGPEARSLSADAGGPYAGEAGGWIAVQGGGSEGNITCSWTGAEFAAPGECLTQVRLLEVGNHTITLTVEAFGETAMDEASLLVSMPRPDGRITGSMQGYNQPGEIGVSNIAATGTEHPLYPAGSGVALAVRSVQSSAFEVSPDVTVLIYILDANGSIAVGPFTTTGYVESLGPGYGFSADSDWTIDQEPGVYYIAGYVDGMAWVDHGSENGHRKIEVIDV